MCTLIINYLFIQEMESRRFYTSHCDVKVLLTCSVCNLCVHTTCYGASEELQASLAVWKCEKCQGDELDAVSMIHYFIYHNR